MTQPRLPCYKLTIRFDRADMVKRFLRGRRTGFYLAVAREGDIGAGDSMVRVAEDESHVTVADVFELYTAHAPSPDLLRRASGVPSLPESWREYFRERLKDLDA